MGEACCQGKSEDLKALADKHAKVLWIVLAINAVMFVVEMIMGHLANSRALMADSLDMLGDTLAYASSIYVLKMSLQAKAKASIFKAALMFLTGLFVIIETFRSFSSESIPTALTISSIGLLALAMNALCLMLLTKHKNDDINFKSVWICSRNDIIANTSVIIAGGLVYLLQSKIPDLVVGLGITVLFLKSSVSVFLEARQSL